MREKERDREVINIKKGEKIKKMKSETKKLHNKKIKKMK